MARSNLRRSAIAPVVASAQSSKILDGRLFTAAELIRLTGMTRKQMAYWDEIGLVRPTMRDPRARTGQPARFYAAQEVVKALVVCELKRAGFTLRQVQQVAQNLEEVGVSLQGSEAYLLTDGVSVFYAFSDQEIVDVMKAHRQQFMLLPLHEQIAKIEEAA